MDKILISHIGLTLKDIRAIRNLFHLNSTWLGNFDLVPESNTPLGQILLVNTDAPRSQKQWQLLSRFKHFESVISLGTLFEFYIPGSVKLQRPLVSRRVAEALKEVTAYRHKEVEDNHRFNILVVDDSLPVRTFMKQKLHDLLGDNAGIDVAENGETAISMVGQAHYDLVFMDVVMPGIDGYKACRTIKSKTKTQVVMLTSKSSTLNRVKAKMSGCDGYITKPPKDGELQHSIKKHLNMGSEVVSSNYTSEIYSPSNALTT